jgi:hypothetical protein
MTEDGRQRYLNSELGMRNSERKKEDRGPKTEGRRQMTDDRGQKSDGRGRKTEVFEFGIGNAEFGKKKRRQGA